MAQEAVRKGGLQQLIQLKGRETDGDAPELAACFVEMKAEIAG
jgi:hypothetical protein